MGARPSLAFREADAAETRSLALAGLGFRTAVDLAFSHCRLRASLARWRSELVEATLELEALRSMFCGRYISPRLLIESMRSMPKPPVGDGTGRLAPVWSRSFSLP